MILLHGTNSWAREMLVLAEYMRPYEKTAYMPNLAGHGGRPLPERFTIADFARDVVAYMDEQGIERDVVAGFSTGGYVAAYLARHYPERVEGAISMGTKFVYDEETVKHFTYLVSLERLGTPGHPRIPQFMLNHHPQDWRELSVRNATLFRELGSKPELSDQDLRAITVPVLLISGENDPIVPAKETLAVKELIPHAELMLVRGPSHPLPALPLDIVCAAIAVWMAKVRKAAPAA